jgi:hypothetical protein
MVECAQLVSVVSMQLQTLMERCNPVAFVITVAVPAQVRMFACFVKLIRPVLHQAVASIPILMVFIVHLRPLQVNSLT